MDSSFRIGGVSACIDGDTRYTTRLDVFLDRTDHSVQVVLKECTPSAGRDGPGGINPFDTLLSLSTGPNASPKQVVNLIREALDNRQHGDVIKHYGSPTKRFSWAGGSKGFSAATIKAELAMWQHGGA